MNRMRLILKGSILSRPSFRGCLYKTFFAVSWVPLLIFFNDHVAEVAWIKGQSMYPYLNSTFNEGLGKDVCWVNKWNPGRKLERGMIVTFWSPSNPEVISVKRVIALEGDMVQTRAPCPYPTCHVPFNHVWVEGDNLDGNKTLDSNTYGPIALPLVQGRVTHLIWPWKRFGPVPWWEYSGRTRVIRGRREDAPHFD